MKQKLLNNFKLRATLLVALLCAAFTGVRADVTDVLNYALTGVSGTSYSSWSGKTSNSDAVYAGQSAGGNSSIQLRSSNNNSGVITTTSGGTVKSISVTWNSNTQSGRTLNVYGKNSAYSAPTDLYNSSSQGTLLGTIVCGTSTKLEIESDYEYIGFRSASGAMYLDKVEIVWEVGGGDTPTLKDCDLALKGTTDLEFDLYNNADAQVINYTTSSTGAVTVANSEYISAVVGNETITVTPLKKTNGAVEITVNQAADDNYKAGSTTFTVNIIDSTPKTGAWVLTSLADLGQGDVFVIVGNNGSNYAMSNDNGTSSAPTAVEVTIENDEITSDVDDNIKWNISGNATDGYTFYPNGASEIWLYCTSANNGVRVGTNDDKTFVIDSNYLKHSATSRYVGVYNSSDWRCYTNTTGNIANQTFAFYKYVDGTIPQKANPELSFSSATAEATFGQAFTAPTLNAATGFNGTVEYSSSVETVAQVMDIETGELKIVGGGTTVITATFAGNDDFKAGSASYTLTVTDNRIATTITQENITIDIADITTLTQLTPVVKDANDNVLAYTNSPTAEGLPEVYFELVGDDTNGIIGSLDSHGNIVLNSVVGTVTVKAVYNQFQLNTDYRPSECTFTITVESPLNGIAEFCTLESGNTGTVRLTDAVVLYVNGKDMFVRDNTGAIDFYNTGLSYEAGNILNGKITAKYTRYNGMDELTTPISDNTLVATAGSAVTPTEITTSVAADNACNLVKLSGVTVTSSNNKFYVGDVQVYDKFKLNYTIEDGKTYDIVGIMIPYNSIYEICPTEAPVEIEDETPTITLEQYEYNLNIDGGDAVLPVTCTNLADDPELAVVFVESDGETATTYEWITATINNEGNIAGHIDPNTGDARTAYFKVSGVDANNKAVYSELVTINQDAYTGPSITFKNSSIELEAGGESDRKMSFEAIGFATTAPTFEVVFFEQDGVTAAEYDWVTTANIEGGKVNLSVAANDGEARTAYFKVHETGFDIYSDLVTITQAGVAVPVTDYATLPFEWDNTSTPTGVTNSGVGSYSSSPYLKFDGTGDYIILKINERPGTLTFDIKGNSFKDGTFTLQTSEDGTNYTDLETYTELGNTQNESFDNLGENVRYIKWIYTEKVSGNVALGNIALAAYVAPPTPVASITFNTNIVEATASETDGTITVSYNNFTLDEADVILCDAKGENADYEWIAASLNADKNIEYLIDANNGDVRTAYMKVYALDGEANEYYSELITINQAAYVTPAETITYTLVSTLTAGKTYVIASSAEEGSVQVMGEQRNNNRGTAEGTIEGTTLSVMSDAGAYEVVAYGPDAAGNYTFYDAAYNKNEGGYLYAASSSSNYLKSQATNDANGKWSVNIDGDTKEATVVAKGSNTRNLLRYNGSNSLFSCYAKDQAPIYFFEKADEAVATTASVMLNAYGFATFATTAALDFMDANDADFSAWEVTQIAGSEITFNQLTGHVAAGKGILLKGNANATVNLNILPTGGTDLDNNLLFGITDDATYAAAGKYYGLKGNEFVPVNEGLLKAGKAVLPVLSSGVKAFTFIFNDADGIQTVQTVSAEAAQAIYNLAGQRLQKAQKGINIINGKKVLVK